MPLGGKARWLAVVSSAAPDGVQLLLEPDSHQAAKPFKSALVRDRIPAISSEVDNVPKDYERLKNLGDVSRSPPTTAGPTTIVVLDDTRGNFIHPRQVERPA